MATPPKSSAANGSNGKTELPPAPQVRVLGQFIRDLSFENPNVGKAVVKDGENPNLQVEINVNAQRLTETVFESAISFKAHCQGSGGVLYDLECIYGAHFDVQNFPQDALEPLLLINCPGLIFPFLRRVVADLTRDGGFPPLWLDPIDFGSLYAQRQQGGAPAETPLA